MGDFNQNLSGVENNSEDKKFNFIVKILVIIAVILIIVAAIVIFSVFSDKDIDTVNKSTTKAINKSIKPSSPPAGNSPTNNPPMPPGNNTIPPGLPPVQPNGSLNNTIPPVPPAGNSSCIPSCTNRECGPNGCGSVCGTCSSGYVCNQTGKCIVVPEQEDMQDISLKSTAINNVSLQEIQQALGQNPSEGKIITLGSYTFTLISLGTTPDGKNIWGLSFIGTSGTEYAIVLPPPNFDKTKPLPIYKKINEDWIILASPTPPSPPSG